MSDAKGKTRRWPLRIAQYSPLLGLALVSLIWSSVPLRAVPDLMSTSLGTRASEWRLLYAETVRHYESLGTGNDFLVNASRRWADWVGTHPNTASVLAPEIVSSDASAFDAIRKWERAHNARVWAWVVPAPAQPSVVASATGDPGKLGRVRAQLGWDQRWGPAPSDDLTWLWARDIRGQTRNELDTGERRIPPLPATYAASTGSSSVNGPWGQLSGFTLHSGGRLWRALIVDTHPALNTVLDEHFRTELAAMDPQSPHFARDIAIFAQNAKVSVWVLGPLSLQSMPLRVPEGSTTTDAAALGKLVWPSLVIDYVYGSPALHPLSGETARLANGSRGFVEVLHPNHLSSEQGNPVDLPTIAFFAAFNTPRLPWWERIQESTQRFIASWFPYLLGGTVGFLVLTLILSPAAFVRERRLIARERVREDMARMRRDAHDKVYNRLSALSKRVAATGDEVATSNATALTAIAEDIRTTVGELQAILGEEVRHTNSALTSVPLAEQLRSVCAAQSALLGVEVSCAAQTDLPLVDPRLGWDLQCIAEEAITNAVRHGGATHVRVSLSATDAALELAVTDDGTGSRILRAEDAPSESTGLRGVRDRLEPRGGSLTLEVDATGGGTALRAQVPLCGGPRAI